MENLLNKFIKFNTIYIVGINVTDEKEVYSILKIKKNKTKLLIKENKTYDAFDEIKGVLKNNIPVILSIDGKNVLNKIINHKDDIDKDWLTNLDKNNIAYTAFKFNETSIISFTRITHLEKFISLFINQKKLILDYYIGITPVLLLKDYINKEEFMVNNYILKIDSNKIIAIDKIENNSIEKYSLDEYSLSNHDISLYASAINFFVNAPQIDKSSLDNKLKSEFIFKIAFEKIGITTLVFFLCALLLSYICTQILIQKNAEMVLENRFLSNLKSENEKLNKKLSDKIKILNESGFANKRYLSFYCYEITNSTPSNLKLNHLEINPLVNEIKLNKKIDISSKTILIKGNTDDKNKLNTWIDFLKKREWLKKLEILSIKNDKNKISFELKLELNNV